MHKLLEVTRYESSTGVIAVLICFAVRTGEGRQSRARELDGHSHGRRERQEGSDSEREGA